MQEVRQPPLRVDEQQRDENERFRIDDRAQLTFLGGATGRGGAECAPLSPSDVQERDLQIGRNTTDFTASIGLRQLGSGIGARMVWIGHRLRKVEVVSHVLHDTTEDVGKLRRRILPRYPRCRCRELRVCRLECQQVLIVNTPSPG